MMLNRGEEALHTPHRTIVDQKIVQHERSPPPPSPSRSPPGWTAAQTKRNTVVLGKGYVTPQTWQSPQAKRIQRMLASTGGATHNPFYASETSKFNSSQPNARRGHESHVIIGEPSPEENARYLEYLLS